MIVTKQLYKGPWQRPPQSKPRAIRLGIAYKSCGKCSGISQPVNYIVLVYVSQ